MCDKYTYSPIIRLGCSKIIVYLMGNSVYKFLQNVIPRFDTAIYDLHNYNELNWIKITNILEVKIKCENLFII